MKWPLVESCNNEIHDVMVALPSVSARRCDAAATKKAKEMNVRSMKEGGAIAGCLGGLSRGF